jgi:hypothetical protein
LFIVHGSTLSDKDAIYEKRNWNDCMTARLITHDSRLMTHGSRLHIRL